MYYNKKVNKIIDFFVTKCCYLRIYYVVIKWRDGYESY